MKIIANKENPNGILVETPAEEISQRETDAVNSEAEFTAKEEARVNHENLKASAKAKLVAGEPLTEEEANTIVL